MVAAAIPRTILPLYRYAQIMGINPVHFCGGAGSTFFPVYPNSQNDVWPRHSWQSSDRVSHEDLAHEIQRAERDIAKVLGHWPAPVWIAQEVHPFPRHYRRDVWRYSGSDVRNNQVAVQTKWGKVIAAGRRKADFIRSVAVTYQDLDLDTLNETARISTSVTTTTDACEVKVYFTGHSGESEWEIRPPRSKTLTAGTFTALFDAWQLIDPDQASAYPTTAGFSALNIADTSIYETQVDIYREYNDTTAVSAVFFWEPTPVAYSALSSICSSCGGAGCAACTLTTQDGCIHLRDPEQGWVVPMPATYDLSDAEWDFNCWSVCRDPDIVQIWYWAGDLSNRNLSGLTCDEMPPDLEMAVAQMATARLERPFCSGANLTALNRSLRTDLARAGEVSYQVSPALLDNPFGTRVGEIEAWRRVGNLREHVVGGCAV